MTKGIRVACFGDVHLGHPKTPTQHIIESLEKAFPDDRFTADLDLIIIEGDLYDRLLELANPVVAQIQLWMARFLQLCIKHNIILRVLEGTPSHDRKQSHQFEVMNEASGGLCNVRHVTTLEIEHIDSLGLSLLYIPDEYRPDPKDTQEEVCGLLHRHNISCVDLVVMHGAFAHQVSEAYRLHANPLEFHDADFYSDIARHAVLIGHYHMYSQWKNIYAAGSFERLAHGEESPKGHIRLRLNGSSHQAEFVVNPRAMIYKTIDLSGLDAQAAHQHLLDQTLKLPEGSHIRVTCLRTEPGWATYAQFSQHHPDFHWTFLKKEQKEKSEVSRVLIDHPRAVNAHCLNKDTLQHLLIEAFSRGQSPDAIDQARGYLKELCECLN